jgi:hypothetical protein
LGITPIRNPKRRGFLWRLLFKKLKVRQASPLKPLSKDKNGKHLKSKNFHSDNRRRALG